MKKVCQWVVTLSYKNDKSKPKFIFKASKDPRGNKIEKFQIVKGWLDENGQPKEKVFTVMETYDGKGQDNFVGIWGDPDFNINQEAFYYAQVALFSCFFECVAHVRQN